MDTVNGRTQGLRGFASQQTQITWRRLSLKRLPGRSSPCDHPLAMIVCSFTGACLAFALGRSCSRCARLLWQRYDLTLSAC